MEQDSAPPLEQLPVPTPIRVETALSRYPVHRLAKKGNVDINIHEESKDGTDKKWEVDYSKKHGQPGPLAYKIDTLIINRRIEEARRPIPRMLSLGSLSDICKELGLSDSGKNRADIKKSLFQNAFANITAKTGYRLADGTERTLEAGFNRYSVILTGESLPDGRKADGVYIILNDVFIQVLNGAMTRPLDYDYLKSLSPAPQRFYELLSYQMYATLKYDRPRAKLTYSELCSRAPQMRHTDWEKVRSQMSKVHKPHRDSGYILKVDFQQTADEEGNPDWIIFYQPGPKARAEYKAFTRRGGPITLEIESAEPEPVSLVPEIERELVQRGITAAVAQELAAGHDEEKIRAHLERTDWLIRKKPSKIGDPAAYLVLAIRKDFAAPAGFVSKAEEERRSEAKKARERQAADEQKRVLEGRRKEQEKLDREREESRLIKEHWESLSPAEQTEIEAKSKVGANSEDLVRENGMLGSTFKWFRREAYLRPLLQAAGKLPADE